MIASRSRRAYLPLMVARRLVRILTMLALLLAPLSMMGGHAAMAMPAGTSAAPHHMQTADASGHCAGMAGKPVKDQRSQDGSCVSDCTVACSAIPVFGSLMPDQVMAPAMRRVPALLHRSSGLRPESDDPPPRFS